MFDPPSGMDNYIFRNFNHDIALTDGYDLKELFNFTFVRNFMYGTPQSIANILAAIIVYKEGGIYLPMDCLPEINPRIWGGVEDFPDNLSTYSAREIKEALQSERYDNPNMLLEDYNALKVVQSELIMEKLKKEHPDIFTSEDPIPTKPFPIEKSDNPGLYSAFDYIKQREIDDIDIEYIFPQGIAEKIKKCVDDFHNENASSPEKFFESFKVHLPPSETLISEEEIPQKSIGPLLAKRKEAPAISSIIQNFYSIF